MKTILLISDSYPIHQRLKKIGQLFKNSDVNYLLWNRENIEVNNNEYYVYSSETGYGKKLEILRDLHKFSRYINGIIKQDKPDIIVARYFLVALVVSVITPKNIKIYYDVCDMPIYNNKILNFIIKLLEKFVLYRADKVILGSRFFEQFYSKYTNKIIVLENKVDTNVFKDIDKTFEKKHSDYLVINYIGKVRYIEVLKKIVLACKGANIVFNFYGDGVDLEQFKKFISDENINNVNIYGRFDYKDVYKYYIEADYILCTYPSEDVNVKYAIPNKFFEALYFNKPIIVSKGTKIAEVVEENGLGISVDCDNLVSLNTRLTESKYIKNQVFDNIEKFKKIEKIHWDNIHL